MRFAREQKIKDLVFHGFRLKFPKENQEEIHLHELKIY